MRRWLSYFREIPLSRVHTIHFPAAGEETRRARRGDSHSPATTTRSNRGFELSPRVRPSKVVMRNPALALPRGNRRAIQFTA